MFLADRYIKGECPNCGAKDQYGDACENCSTVYSATELKNPYSALSGAKPVLKTSQHHFFKLSDPKCKAFMRRWLETPGRLQPQVVNKAKEWLDGKGEKALADWDISRDPPYFGIRIPDLTEEKYLYVWLDAPIGYLACFKNYCAQEGARLRAIPARPENRADPLHRQGHHLLPHAVLAGDAGIRGQALQGARPRLRARLHHRVGRQDVQVARHRHRSAALSQARHEPRVAALLHRRQAQRQRRGPRLQSRRLPRPREQRPGRQVRQHRGRGGELHLEAVRRRAFSIK